MEKIKNVVIFVLFFMFCFLLLFSISKRDKYEKEIYILKSKASAYEGVVMSFQIMEEFARKNNLKIDDIIKFYTINDSIYITKTDVNKIKKNVAFWRKNKMYTDTNWNEYDEIFALNNRWLFFAFKDSIFKKCIKAIDVDTMDVYYYFHPDEIVYFE